jgi:hypothetical protein
MSDVPTQENPNEVTGGRVEEFMVIEENRRGVVGI